MANSALSGDGRCGSMREDTSSLKGVSIEPSSGTVDGSHVGLLMNWYL